MQEIYNVKELKKEMADRYAYELFCIEDFNAYNVTEEDSIGDTFAETAQVSISFYGEDMGEWLGHHFYEVNEKLRSGYYKDLEDLIHAAQVEYNEDELNAHGCAFVVYYMLDCLEELGVESISDSRLGLYYEIAGESLGGRWGEVKSTVETIQEEAAE